MRPTLALAVMALLVAGPASAQTTWRFDRATTDISFVTHRFGAAVATGKFERYDGTLALDIDQPEKSRIKVVIETNSLEAGSSLMDGFIKGESMLDVARYPTASFTSARVTRTGDRSLEIRGQLSIRAKTQPFTVTAVVDGDIDRARRGEKLPFHASGTFQRPAYDIGRDVNVVDDAVEIVIKGQLSR
jgi:polyisoprenoid-binding protein YceI